MDDTNKTFADVNNEAAAMFDAQEEPPVQEPVALHSMPQNRL